MRVPLLCRTPFVALAVLTSSICAQDAKLDARSQELIQQADAALGKARTISVVQTQHVSNGAPHAKAPNNMRGPEVSILAARPAQFRVVQSGRTAEWTVSTGSEWIRYLEKANAYQKTDIANYTPAQLYRAPNPLQLLQTRRGLASLWLGNHSLRALLSAGPATYDGVQKLHGIRAHRITVKTDPVTYQLYLSTTEPFLPVFFVGFGLDTSHNVPTFIRLELAFADWQLDPTLPADAFAFEPPQGATQVEYLTGREERTGADNLAAWLSERPAAEAKKEVRPAPPGKPFPSGPDVVTSPVYLAQVRAHHLAAMEHWYEAHGHRDPKWDKAMLDLYARWIQRLTGDRSLKVLMDLRESAYYIQSLGCHDPFLGYLVANLTYHIEGGSSSAVWKPSWEALRDSSYPALVKLSPLRRYIGALKKAGNRDQELLPELSDLRTTLFAQAIAEPEYAAGGQRAACYSLDSDWDDMSLSDKGRTVEKMKTVPNADPWLRSYYSGRYYYAMSWEGGAGDPLAMARKELTDAWKLHPEFPEAPTYMIEVASVEGGEESERFWFDRAIAGQIDWDPAYDRMRWAYDTMRGGDPHWMYELGLEAARTKRFDSFAPHQYWEMLNELRSHLGTWDRILSLPGALDTLNMVCDGYVAQGGDDYPPEYWETVRLFAFWAVKDYAAANTVLQRLHGHLHYGPFQRIIDDPDRVVEETRLLGGPEGKPILAALKLLDEGKTEAAVPLLRQAMQALRETSPRDSYYLGERICTIPFADAPGVANQILDTILEMRRREVLVQSYINWQMEGQEEIPDAFQDRVAAYLGPICWAFMREAPTDITIPNEEIEARIARIGAIQPADIPGIKEVPPEDVAARFDSEKRLAILRLLYCWEPTYGQRWQSAWQCAKTRVVPLVKNFPEYGLLIDFLTEHNDWGRHHYDYDMESCLKIMAQVQEIGGWEQWGAYPFFPQVDDLAQIDDPEARVAAAWQLYWRRGVPLLGFRIKQVLDQTGDPVQAALMERHLLTYLSNFLEGPCRTNDESLVYAVELNSVPGYEEQLIGHAQKKHGDTYECEIQLTVADAHTRLGELDEAVKALVASKAESSSMDHWMYVADGRYRGAGECLNALLQAIAQHPNATPDTLSLLAMLFPDRMAQIGAR